jgi:hypothetical protein
MNARASQAMRAAVDFEPTGVLGRSNGVDWTMAFETGRQVQLRG